MAQFSKDNGRLPRILVGNFKNDSDEHIDTGIIANTMRAAITNNGKADFVASGSARDEIRTEKEDQLGNVSDDTAASIGRETGADFILNGTVKTIVERAGNMSTRSYFVTSEITHIESGLVYWMDQNDEIKKIIQTPRVKF
jgi:PBP1b-binding outer membrane lipoprotein LpoB